MSDPIQTTGMSGGPITTHRNPGEATGAWITRHDAAVSKGTPTGNTLVTSWTSGNGEQATTTNRQQGESDKDFRVRHQNAYLVAMWTEEPIP